MEPLIKESTNRLAEKICAVAENGEVVDALQYVMQLSVCEYTLCYYGDAVGKRWSSGTIHRLHNRFIYMCTTAYTCSCTFIIFTKNASV